MSLHCSNRKVRFMAVRWETELECRDMTWSWDRKSSTKGKTTGGQMESWFRSITYTVLARQALQRLSLSCHSPSEWKWLEEMHTADFSIMRGEKHLSWNLGCDLPWSRISCICHSDWLQKRSFTRYPHSWKIWCRMFLLIDYSEGLWSSCWGNPQ